MAWVIIIIFFFGYWIQEEWADMFYFCSFFVCLSDAATSLS